LEILCNANDVAVNVNKLDSEDDLED